MTTELAGTLGAICLMWLALFAAASYLTTLTWPWLARRIDRAASPARRARRLIATSLAPVLLPSVVVGAVLVPGLVELLGGPADHCTAHADHPHLCLGHPGIAASPALVLALVVAGAIALARLAPAIRHGARAIGIAMQLRRLPSRPLARDLHRIESARAFCFTAGLLRPKIRISDGLWRGLDEAQRAVVVAHERAHARRRDPLVFALAAASTLGLATRARRELLAALTQACERACDEAAAVAVGDRLRVAETLLAAERIVGRESAPGMPRIAPAFAGTGLDERVLALVQPDAANDHGADSARGWRSLLAAAWIGGATLLVALPLHHAIEHVLEMLLELA